MRYLPDGSWMQKADAHTIREIGIPSLVLMERAALKTVEAMHYCQMDCRNVLVVCGSGNNGGDGFAVARLLACEGSQVTVMFAGRESSMSEECRIQSQIVKNLGISVVTSIPEKEYTVIVDAVFGVGLSRAVEGNYADVIAQLNQMNGAKVAVDIPSGICSASGRILGCAFKADLTVSYQCEKLGTVLFPGSEYAGIVMTADIGIDTEFFQNNQEVCYTLDRQDIWKRLPKRKANSHKGSYGKVLMITGSEGMAGAAYLSAQAAYACGAGLVQIYTHEMNRAILQQLLPQAIISVYDGYDNAKIKSLLKWADIVCIGCGLGQNNISEQLLKAVMTYCEVPCIIDADGINILACHRELMRNAAFPVVLTPHMKEMAGLLGCSIEELAQDRFRKLLHFTGQYPAICVLKDARTVVAERTHPYFVNTAGNQAMAKAGSGDVLAGTITGLLAQHMDVYEGTVLGVYIHACGGDAAKEKQGSYGTLADDLIQGIRECLKKAEEEG